MTAASFRDVFVHDRETGETTRLSQVSFGDRIEEGDNSSSHPRISGDGRYVAYLSGATNLDPDRDQATNLYLHDRETGRNRQIAFNESGMEHPQEPVHVDISDDGTLIAYTTYPGSQLPPEGVVATPMDERGTNYEVWLHDTAAGTTTKMVSFDLSGMFAPMHGPQVTPDGAFVWVESGGGGTFVFERATGTVTDLGLSVEVSYLVPFPDGDRIAFTSGNALVAGDVNGVDDAYVFDRSTGQFRLLAEFGPDWGGRPSSITSDGRYLAIASQGNAPRVIDTADGGIATELSASLGLGTLEISGDGGWAAFSTSAELVDGDTNGRQDVFVGRLPAADPDGGEDEPTTDAGVTAGDNGEVPSIRPEGAGAITRVSVDSEGIEGEASSGNPSISADGRYVAFDSLASLVDPDGGAHHDVFVHDRETGVTTRVSQLVRDDGVIEEADGASFHPQISADGRYVAFVSSAENLNSNVDDANGASDIFLHDRESGDLTLVSVAPDGSQHGLSSIDPSMSDDGNLLAYATYGGFGGDRPAPGEGTGPYTAWVYDVAGGTTTRLAEFETSDPGVDLSPPIAAASGSLAAVSGLWGGVFVYESSTGEAAEIADLRGLAWPVVWGEGGRYYFNSCDDSLWVNDDDTCDIFTWDAGTQQFEPLLDTDRHMEVAGVTSDGRFVLISDRHEGGALVVDQTDGTSLELLSGQRADDFDLSSDGRFAAFVSPEPGLVEDDTNFAEDVFVVQIRDAVEPVTPPRPSEQLIGGRRRDQAAELRTCCAADEPAATDFAQGEWVAESGSHEIPITQGETLWFVFRLDDLQAAEFAGYLNVEGIGEPEGSFELQVEAEDGSVVIGDRRLAAHTSGGAFTSMRSPSDEAGPGSAWQGGTYYLSITWRAPYAADVVGQVDLDITTHEALGDFAQEILDNR